MPLFELGVKCRPVIFRQMLGWFKAMPAFGD